MKIIIFNIFIFLTLDELDRLHLPIHLVKFQVKPYSNAIDLLQLLSNEAKN